jgi:hypothetical protein
MFAWQVDRKGNRRPTKTYGSARTVPIPRELTLILARHNLASRDIRPEAFVFANRSGRPVSQGTSPVRSARHSSTRRTSTASRRSSSSKRSTLTAGQFLCPPAPCHRCIPSATQSPLAPARRGERRRSRVPARTPRRHRNPHGLRTRDRRRPPPAHATLTDDRRTRRRSPGGAGGRGRR